MKIFRKGDRGEITGGGILLTVVALVMLVICSSVIMNSIDDSENGVTIAEALATIGDYGYAVYANSSLAPNMLPKTTGINTLGDSSITDNGTGTFIPNLIVSATTTTSALSSVKLADNITDAYKSGVPIVDTTSSQIMTNKTIDTVTPANLALVDDDDFLLRLLMRMKCDFGQEWYGDYTANGSSSYSSGDEGRFISLGNSANAYAHAYSEIHTQNDTDWYNTIDFSKKVKALVQIVRCNNDANFIGAWQLRASIDHAASDNLTDYGFGLYVIGQSVYLEGYGGTRGLSSKLFDLVSCKSRNVLIVCDPSIPSITAYTPNADGSIGSVLGSITNSNSVPQVPTSNRCGQTLWCTTTSSNAGATFGVAGTYTFLYRQ